MANDNNKGLARLETNMKELVERTTSLEQLGKMAAFLLHQQGKLAAKCEDLESRVRRNNKRIRGIPEGSEKNDMIRFVTEDTDIRTERAHHSLTAKQKEKDQRESRNT